MVAGRVVVRDVLKILIVEDEPLVAALLADWVTSWGFEVIGPVASEAQAFEIIEREPLDGAILDINLGGLDGWSIPFTLLEKDLPFVVVTSYNPSTLPQWLSVAPTLSKPVDEIELRAVLASHLGRATS